MNNRRSLPIRILVTGAVLFLGAIFCFIFPRTVRAKEYFYSNVDVDIAVNEDSTFGITETMTFILNGEFRGVFREIPLTDEKAKEICKQDPSKQCGGFEYMTLQEVKGNGRSLSQDEYRFFLTYTSTEPRLRIEWEFAPNGQFFEEEVFTWSITYVVFGGLGYFEDYDLFYWDTLFPEREVDIKRASIHIHFPTDISFSSEDLKVLGVGNQYSYSYIENTLELAPTTILEPYTDFTVVLKIPKGIISEYGDISIKTTPSPVDVSIEPLFDLEEVQGNLSGIPPGEYSIVLSKEGYEDKRIDIEVKPGETTIVNEQLRPYPSLMLISDQLPFDLEIEGVGQYYTTSGLISNLPEGIYTVVVSKEGYVSESYKVILDMGEQIILEVNLLERPSIQIEVNPEVDYIEIDGKKYYLEARGSNVIKGLSEGKHTVTITKEGYHTKEVSVNLQNGKQEVLEVQLEMALLEKARRFFVITVNVGAIPLLLILIVISIARSHRRRNKNKIRKAIIPIFKPPNNIIPSILGTLKDESIDMVDITAAIINAGFKGYIQIKQIDKGNYQLTKQKAIVSLNSCERFILDQIFGKEKQVNTSDLKYSFYKKIPLIERKLRNFLYNNKYFFKGIPKQNILESLISAVFIVVGVVSSCLLFILQIYCIGPSVLIAGFINLVLAQTWSRRTRKGEKLLHDARGFKMYLETAERYRLQNLTPKTFEKFLPYAMIFGIERLWAEKFKDIYKTPPDWFIVRDSKAFNTISFVSSMSGLHNVVSNAMISRPVTKSPLGKRSSLFSNKRSSSSTFKGGGFGMGSSGSSSSSGGGFSGSFGGGGGGGGAGGAW